MDCPKKDGAFKISDLSRILTSMKSAPCETTSPTTPVAPRESFRSRAVLPDHINQLCECVFERRDYYKESLAAAFTPTASSQEDQPSIPPPHPLAYLLQKSNIFPSESIDSIGERLRKQETHLQILGEQYRTQQQSSEPVTLPPGPVNEWFFRDLKDLQRKLYFGASKKYGNVKKKVPTSPDQNQEHDAKERKVTEISKVGSTSIEDQEEEKNTQQ